MKKQFRFFKFLSVAVFFYGANVHAQYCTPTYVDNCIYGDGINDFVLTGSGINHLGSGCSTAGYGDFSATAGLYGTLQASVSYNLNLTHDYFSSQFTKIWIDFNNDFTFDDVTEMVFQSAAGSTDGTTSGSFLIPVSQPAVTGIRMRVMVTYSDWPSGSCATDGWYGETHDYTVDILAAPPCPSPIDITAIDIAAMNAIIGWTEQGTATDYNVEWGAPGFAPGTGAEIGAASVSGATEYDVTGLTPSTDYEFYVQADCGVDGLGLFSGPFFFTTTCVPVSSLPWSEGFESVSPVGSYIYPDCWVHENAGFSDGWNVHDNFWGWGDADALSGSNFLAVNWGSDAYIWTPEFELTGGETYEFVFNWAGDEYDGWFGEVLVNDAQSSAGATVLGDPFVILDEPTTLNYQEEIYCFTPSADGVYSFAIHVVESYYWYYLSVDDVSLRMAGPSAGTDAVYDACISEGLIDLNSIGAITDPNGSWIFDTNPSALVDDTLLNIMVVPAGALQVIYEPKGCLAPDVIIDLNVHDLSSAGNDGLLDACMNQQVDLLGGLSGSVDLGGSWYDPSGNAIPDSYFMTGTVPGSYDYEYVTGNGACPDDTAVVTLTILSCDYLSAEELPLDAVTVYPNPTSGLFYISSPDMAACSYVITDLSGREVAASGNAVVNGTHAVDLTIVEDGVYMVRVFNATGEKVYRIVKN